LSVDIHYLNQFAKGLLCIGYQDKTDNNRPGIAMLKYHWNETFTVQSCKSYTDMLFEYPEEEFDHHRFYGQYLPAWGMFVIGCNVSHECWVMSIVQEEDTMELYIEEPGDEKYMQMLDEGNKLPQTLYYCI